MTKKNHRPYIICNWNERAFGVIIQLHSDLLRFEGEDYEVKVVAPSDVPLRKLNDSYGKYFYNVEFHKGDPSDRTVLETAGVSKARSVLVLADWSSGGTDPADADARTLLTFLALKKLRETTGADFRVVLELLEETNRRQFGNLLADKDWLQVLPAQRVEARVFSQAARVPGLASMYFGLLSFTRESNEVYRVPCPKGLVDLSLSEVWAKLRANLPEDELPIPIGIAWGSNGALHPNPMPRFEPGDGGSSATPAQTQQGDDLVLISRSPPDLSAFEEVTP